MPPSTLRPRASARASGDLNVYGDAFARFPRRATRRPPTLPYLPDVARLEWAIDEAHRAADAPRVPGAVLAALATSRAGTPDRGAPRARAVVPDGRVAYPILRIWQVNQPDHDGDDRVSTRRGRGALLVRRDARGVALELLAAGERAWLAALGAGARSATAIDAAQAADAAFDLGAALRAHIAARNDRGGRGLMSGRALPTTNRFRHRPWEREADESADTARLPAGGQRAVRFYAGLARSPTAAADFALRCAFTSRGFLHVGHDQDLELEGHARAVRKRVSRAGAAAARCRVLGTAAELGLPVLLALGLCTRAAALALFVFNIVAATSYPDLSAAGLKDHILWGALMLVTLFYGPGNIALDEWIKRHYSA